MIVKKCFFLISMTTLFIGNIKPFVSSIKARSEHLLSPSNPVVKITNNTNREATKIKINVMFRDGKITKGHVYVYNLEPNSSKQVNIVENAKKGALRGKLNAIYIIKIKAYFKKMENDQKKAKARQKFEPGIKTRQIAFLHSPREHKHFAIIKIQSNKIFTLKD